MADAEHWLWRLSATQWLDDGRSGLGAPAIGRFHPPCKPPHLQAFTPSLATSLPWR